MGSDKVMLGDNVPRIAITGAIDSRNGPVRGKFGEGQIVLCSAVPIPSLVLLFLSLDKFNKVVCRARVQQVSMNRRRRLRGDDNRGCGHGHGQCRVDTTARPRLGCRVYVSGAVLMPKAFLQEDAE